MKKAIVGAGSMGLVLGAYISKAGEQVDLIDVNKEHIAALKKDGAHIIGTTDIKVPVNAMTPEEISGKYDLIFLMTKQLFNKSIVESMLPNMKDDTVIIAMQNGLPEPSIADVIGEDRVVGGVIDWGATYTRPGVSELTSETGSLTFEIGTITGRSNPKMQEIKKTLELMGPTKIEENFAGARWAKLLINSAFSGMSAVLGCTFGEVAGNRHSRYCAQAIMKELIDVCKAIGVRIEPIQGKDAAKLVDYNNVFKKTLTRALYPIMMKKHKLLKASMLQDLEKGRKCEVDAINGVVCKHGQQAGVPTPYNDLLVEIVHSIEEGKRTYSFENLELFKKIK